MELVVETREDLWCMTETDGGIWRVFTAGGVQDVVKKATTMVRLMYEMLSSGLKILWRTTDKVECITKWFSVARAIKIIIGCIEFVVVSYIIHNNSKSVVLFPVLCDDAINPCDVAVAMMVMTSFRSKNLFAGRWKKPFISGHHHCTKIYHFYHSPSTCVTGDKGLFTKPLNRVKSCQRLYLICVKCGTTLTCVNKSKLWLSYLQMCTKGTFYDLCFASKAWYLWCALKLCER